MDYYAANSKNVVQVYLAQKNLPDMLSGKKKLENNIIYLPTWRVVD